MHLAALILHGLGEGMAVRLAVNSDADERLARSHCLRNNNGTIAVVRLRQHLDAAVGSAIEGNLSRLQVELAGADGIVHQYRLVNLLPFRVRHAFALHQCHTYACQLMMIVNDNLVRGGLHVRGLSPQQVGSLVVGHFPLLRQCVLLPTHLEGICRGIFDKVHTGIIAIHVDGRTAVAPINLQGGRPHVFLTIEGVEHVGGTVAVGCKCARHAVLVVNDVDTHAVASDETKVGCPRHIILTQVAAHPDNAPTAHRILVEEGVTTSDGHKAAYHQTDDFSCG